MLSLCLIVKNEEKILEKFLKNLKNYVDEIIIVDTGSKDKTKEIAKKFTKKVFDFKWNDDFSKARNFSIEKATQPWILVLDPDEVIEKKDLTKLKELTKQKNSGREFSRSIELKEKSDILGYRIIQKSYHKNKLISVRGICRLFKNNKNIKFIYPIHETVRNSIKELGKIGKTGIIIKHYPKLNKKDYYLKLLKIKKELYPKSNVDKEIELERKYSVKK